MKVLKIIVIAILLSFFTGLWHLWSNPIKLERLLYPLENKELIYKASKDYSIDPYLISAIIYEESKFNPQSKSRAGAIGLMQVMPDTGNWIAEKQVRRFTVDDLYLPEVNIDMGCWYFSYLRAKYKDERLALAAYNSGDKNVDRWLKDSKYGTIDEMLENIPYKETRVYIPKILETKKTYERLYPDEFREPVGP